MLHMLQPEASLMCHHLYMSLYSLVSTGKLDVYLLRPVYSLSFATALHQLRKPQTPTCSHPPRRPRHWPGCMGCLLGWFGIDDTVE